MEIDEKSIAKYTIKCKYCYKEITSEDGFDAVIKLVYHIHEVHIDEEEEDPFAPGGRLD